MNTKSSTEAELVGVTDCMPQVLWTRYFLECQGYNVTDSIVYQDNQIAILLEKNGHGSSSKRTSHINIQYFFVVYRVANGEVKIEYCPTGDMLVDFFTKPLQGSTFRKFRNQIMNLDTNSAHVMSTDHRSVLSKHQSNQTKTKLSMNETKQTKATTSLRIAPGPQVAKRMIKNELRGMANSAIASY
jgi:hypothetical protein